MFVFKGKKKYAELWGLVIGRNILRWFGCVELMPDIFVT